MELKILTACLMDRGCYNLASKYLETKDISPETQHILKTIGEFYERDPDAGSADRALIEHNCIAAIPDHQAKRAEIFGTIFDRLPKEVSVDNFSEYIISTKRSRIEAELHQGLLAKLSPNELLPLMEKWREVGGLSDQGDTVKEIYTGWDISDLVADHFEPSGLIKLLPAGLNRRVDGGARPGHNILVFAPTEIGKTLFCINLVRGFLKQKMRVLYIGNEDPIPDINMRLVTNLTNLTKEKVRENAKELKPILDKANYNLFTIAGLAPGNFADIQDIANDIDPHVIILDQLGNLDMGVKDGSPTLQLLMAAKAARAMGKRDHRLMVSVAQAADSAYGRRLLRKNDVQWSNVDLPAQLDLQLGIGATEEMEAMGTRTIVLLKDKLSGNHEPLDVKFIKEYSKVEEI